MNSVVFFAELEKAFQNSSFAELKEIILSLAKQVAAEDREVFLKTHFGTSLVSRQQVDVVWDETDFLLEQLRAIEQGELTLLAKFNEHFDDWYDDWDGMFEFSDDDGLVTILKQVLLLIDTLLNQNKLVEALELAKRLEQLEVGVDGDYNDYTADRFTLISFEEYGLMPNVYKPFLSQLIYLTYQTTNLGERAEALFSLFEKNRHYRLSLDELLQEWGIFEDLQEFLPLWLDYLGKTKGDLAYKLLVEALDLKTEETDVFAFAKSVALVHPTFLGTYFKENSSSLAPAVCLAKGYEALKLLPINESNRSDIALLLTSFVDDESERYGLWVEVFKSRPNLVNLFRLLPLTDDRRLELHHFIQQLDQEVVEPFDFVLARMGNHSDRQAKALEFFVGDLEEIFWTSVHTSKTLGWSATFTKLGLSLYLLFCLEGSELRQACSVLLNNIIKDTSFSASAFYQYHKEQIKDSQQLFFDLFQEWKLGYVSVKENAEELLAAMEKMMAKRVKAVMDGNHRAQYEECVVYLAAIGEVRESRGQAGAKQAILKKYRDKYSRRTNFRRDLKTFGLKE